MSPIAYLFYEEVLEDLVHIRDAEEAANAEERLLAIKYCALDGDHLKKLGRREPPPGTGPFVIQIIRGERHSFTGDQFNVWVREYMEYLNTATAPAADRGTHIRSTMGAGKIKVKDITGPPVQSPKSTTKVSVTTGSRPNIGESSTSIQLMEPDAFLEDFAQDGRR
jgi:hypothetical protein